MTHPTFVDGDLDPYAQLKPGSKLTFLDGSGFVLRQMKHSPQESWRPELPRWAIVISTIAGLAIVTGLVYTAWQVFG